MAIFQLLDMMPSVGNGEVSTTVTPKAEFTNGQSSCKNPSRLSLANLMPSRLENDDNDFYDFRLHLYSFANFTLLYISCAVVV